MSGWPASCLGVPESSWSRSTLSTRSTSSTWSAASTKSTLFATSPSARRQTTSTSFRTLQETSKTVSMLTQKNDEVGARERRFRNRCFTIVRSRILYFCQKPKLLEKSFFNKIFLQRNYETHFTADHRLMRLTQLKIIPQLLDLGKKTIWELFFSSIHAH